MPLKSEGICIYCNETVSKQGRTRHISMHLKKMEKELEKENKNKAK